jgi:cytoskeletal protein CcmA (bactofilin family)
MPLITPLGNVIILTNVDTDQQYIIDTTPPGESLNSAFVKVNDNFDQIFAAGPVLSNIQIVNNTVLTLNTNGNLILNPNGVGSVIANAHVIPDTANVRDLGTENLRWRNLYVQFANVSGNLDISGDYNIQGNLTVGGLIDGNNIEINNATVSSNVNAVNGNFTGNIVVDTVRVRTIQLNPNAGPNVNTLPNITVVNDTVFEGNVDVDGTLFVMGNVNADYLIGNGSQLTGVVHWITAPVSNTSPGSPGQTSYDSGGNLYICVVANSWAKFSGTTSW